MTLEIYEEEPKEPTKPEREILENIIDEIRLIEDATRNFDQFSFEEDIPLQKKVVKNFAVLGENISMALQKNFGIAFQAESRIWNKFGEKDYKIDAHEMWQNIERDLPELNSTVEAIIGFKHGVWNAFHVRNLILNMERLPCPKFDP